MTRQALILLHQSLERREKADEINLLDTVRGIAFFGVPNRGMDNEALRSIVGDGPNRSLVEHIGWTERYLQDQHLKFLDILETEMNLKVLSLYETVESPTLQQVCICAIQFLI